MAVAGAWMPMVPIEPPRGRPGSSFRRGGTMQQHQPGGALSARLSRGGGGPVAATFPVAPAPAKQYNPRKDFPSAAGDGDPNLDLLPGEVALFFLCELASLHTAMHEDDQAATLLWRARSASDKLPGSHPDTAVVWGSLGRAAYRAGDFEVAARAMSKGRWIRERTVGGDTVETATSYNNLACCLAALDRPREALAFFELSEELLRVLAGEDHPRTQTALRNLEKARGIQKHLSCEVPHLFSYWVKDDLGKVKKKRRKRRGRSRSGSRKGSMSSKGSRRSQGSMVSRSSTMGSRRSSASATRRTSSRGGRRSTSRRSTSRRSTKG